MNFRRSMIIAELWRPEVAKRLKKNHFWRFFGKKTTPYGKIFKILFQKDLSSYRSTCCVYLADGKSVKSCAAYLTKKFAWLSSSRYCVINPARIAPKICQGQPHTMYSECSRVHPNQFTFGGVTSKRMNTVGARSKVNPIFG